MIDTAARAEMVRTLMALEFIFAMLPGFYGVFYVLGQILHRRWLTWLGYGFGLAQLVVTEMMIRTGYLDTFTIRLMIIIALAYLVLPPTLWHLAKAIHRVNTRDELQA
ncbi:MAG: hypothetical protein GXO54_08065 [Chloroflexi bacterium]|nr:hypothetical protein [Chloroflexota bacterium]